jgi:hypothetical protein
MIIKFHKYEAEQLEPIVRLLVLSQPKSRDFQ